MIKKILEEIKGNKREITLIVFNAEDGSTYSRIFNKAYRGNCLNMIVFKNREGIIYCCQEDWILGYEITEDVLMIKVNPSL